MVTVASNPSWSAQKFTGFETYTPVTAEKDSLKCLFTQFPQHPSIHYWSPSELFAKSWQSWHYLSASNLDADLVVAPEYISSPSVSPSFPFSLISSWPLTLSSETDLSFWRFLDDSDVFVPANFNDSIKDPLKPQKKIFKFF